MRYPLVGLCISFCLGIIAAAYLKISLFIFCLLAFLFLIFAIVCISQDTKFIISILCTGFFLGGASLKNSQALPAYHIAKQAPYKSECVALIGVIDSDPVYRAEKVSFILKVEKLEISEFSNKKNSPRAQINGRSAIFLLCPTAHSGLVQRTTEGSQKILPFFSLHSTQYQGHQDERSNMERNAPTPQINKRWIKAGGKVLVRVCGKNRFFYGDRLFLKGGLYCPFSFFKDGFNYGDYLKRRGIYFVLSIKGTGIIKRLGENAGNPIKSIALRIRHKMKDVIVKNLSSFFAGILNAIILGERQDLAGCIRDVLVYSGTVHIIAISGLHLGIVTFIILLALKIIKVPRRPRYILTILLLVFYCLLTGANSPVLRSTVMATILLFGYFLKREVNIYNSLSIAALIILAVNPWQLFEISFQLSFLSVVSIVWLSPKIKSIFAKKLNKIPCIRLLLSIFSVSLAAWLGLLPLIAYYFKVFSPITILANMLIVPYMTIIVAAGFSLVLIGILIPFLGPTFAASNALFILILFKINSLLIAIPGAYFKLPPISFVYVLFYYALLISILNLKNRGRFPLTL